MSDPSLTAILSGLRYQRPIIDHRQAKNRVTGVRSDRKCLKACKWVDPCRRSWFSLDLCITCARKTQKYVDQGRTYIEFRAHDQPGISLALSHAACSQSTHLRVNITIPRSSPSSSSYSHDSVCSRASSMAALDYHNRPRVMSPHTPPLHRHLTTSPRAFHDTPR